MLRTREEGLDACLGMRVTLRIRKNEEYEGELRKNQLIAGYRIQPARPETEIAFTADEVSFIDHGKHRTLIVLKSAT